MMTPLQRHLRVLINRASIRPSPGTSDLLHRPYSVETVPSVVRRSHNVTMYDLVNLAPIHLASNPAYGKAPMQGKMPAPTFDNRKVKL